MTQMHYVTPSRFIGFCVVEWSEILHAFAQFLMTFVSQAFNFHSRLLFDAIGTVARLRDTKKFTLEPRGTHLSTQTPNKELLKALKPRLWRCMNPNSLGCIKSIPNSTIFSIQGVVYIWAWVEFLRTTPQFTMHACSPLHLEEMWRISNKQACKSPKMLRNQYLVFPPHPEHLPTPCKRLRSAKG